MSTPVLWQPDNTRPSHAMAFIDSVNQTHGLALQDFHDLYQWSIAMPEAFWRMVWDYSDIIGTIGNTTCANADDLLASRWFPNATLNFAENLLRHKADKPAIIFRAEDQIAYQLSHQELYQQVASVAAWLKSHGVTKGDRVAGFLPNMPETVVAMLAAASLGAIWSSCSPDFGVQGVLDRFGQIEPKVLFCADGYVYNGKTHDCLTKTADICQQLSSVEHVVLIPLIHAGSLAQAITWESVLTDCPNDNIDFVPMGFNDPLYIMFSSGTTGVPKCIVHGVGGTLLQHKKEHLLHCEIKPDDKVFYFTTCGWMMWNWLVSSLASNATLMLYDGAPVTKANPAILFDYLAEERIQLFGTSAKYIDAIRKLGLDPKTSHDLGALQTILSTGSVLTVEGFDYVYQQIKQDVCLSSISGGTDIISCFVLGTPTLPVHRGELQTRGLGMAVEVWDESGQAVTATQGELVCTKTFPSKPIGFWNDPDNQKYHAAYFDTYPNIWCHGDYVTLTEHQGMVFYGRSDTTLNPGGVRIGTAEIYRQVEAIDEVLESIVVGQEWHGDVRVVLFVVLRDGLSLDEALHTAICQKIRTHTTARHVPAKIIQINEIPRTKSGKIVEIAVRDTIHGRPIKNKTALANPEALAQFQNIGALQTD